MKVLLIGLVTSLLLLSIGGMANAETIMDNYVGGTPTNNYGKTKDVVGDEKFFGITKMEVSVKEKILTVDIFTNYVNYIGKYETALGDLFISTNGWEPFGNPKYYDDDYSNGEQWEYALVMNKRPSSSTKENVSGTASLYRITDPKKIVLSSAPAGYTYRKGQEVQFNASGLASISSGNWWIDRTGTDDFLRFQIGLAGLGPIDDLGFHWGMTCGNDVIEGGFAHQNPEPATMILFGFGLIGVAGIGRRKLS